MTQVSGPGINATYSYNGLDTRVGKTENSVSNTFRRSGAYVSDQVVTRLNPLRLAGTLALPNNVLALRRLR